MEVARLTAVIDANTSGFTRAMKQVDSDLDSTHRAMGRYIDANGRMRDANGRFVAGAGQVDGAISKNHKGFLNLGRVGGVAALALGGVGVVAGGALAIGLTKGVQSLMTFDAQMAKVRAVTGASAAQMELYKKAAIDTGMASTFSASEAAAAQVELGKAGLTTAQILGGGFKSTLALASAGEMELAEAAATTANVMGTFGIAAKDTMHISDALATAANSTTADVSDFALAFQMGGSAAKLAGMDFDQASVSLMALAKIGVKGSDAGTSLKAALTQIAKPTDEAAAAMEQYNLAFFKADGSMKSVTQISAMLRKETAGLSKQQRLALFSTIAGTDGMRTLAAMYASTPGELQKYTDALAKKGTAEKQAATMNDNLGAAFDTMKNAVDAVSLTFMTALEPTLTRIVSGMTSLIQTFAQSGAIQAFAQTVSSAIATLSQMFSSGGGVGAQVGALGVAFQQIGQIAMQVAPAIGTYLGATFQTIGRIAAAVAPIIASAFKTIGPTIGPLVIAIANLGAKVQQVMGTVLPPIIRALAPVFQVAFRAIAEVIRAVTAILEGDWSAAMRHLVNIPMTILSGLGGIFLNLISKAASGVAQGVKALWEALSSGLSDLVSQVMAKGAEIGRAIIDGIVNAIKAAPGAIKDALAGILGDAISFAKGILGIASPSKVFAFLGEMTMEGYLKGLESKDKKVPEAIRNTIRKGLNAAISESNALLGSLREAFPYMAFDTTAKINLRSVDPGSVQAAYEKVKTVLGERIDKAMTGGIGSLGSQLGRFTNNLLRAYDAETQAGVRDIQKRLDGALSEIQGRYRAAENAARGALSSRLAGIESDRKALTPAEAALQAEEDARAKREAEAKKAQALEDLRRAQIRGNANEILAAQKALDDIAYQEKIDALRTQAEAERAQRDADAQAKTTQAQTEFDTWLAQQQTNMETELQSKRDAYAQEQLDYEANREAMRVKREDELARMTENLTRRNMSVRDKLKALKAITTGPLASAIAASGGTLGQAFADSLGTSETAIRRAVERIGNLLKAYLKLNSPADKGPLSSLDSWWTAMPDTLLAGVDTSMIGDVAAAISAPPVGVSGSGGSGGSVIVNVTVQGSVTAEQDLAETIRRELIKTGQRNGGNIFGSYA